LAIDDKYLFNRCFQGGQTIPEKELKGKSPMTAKRMSLLLTLLFCAGALAEDANTTFLLGPSMVVLVKPYEGKHAEVFPYPLSVFVYDRFYFAVDTVGYRLLASQRGSPEPGQTYWYFDAVGKWRSDGYDSDDSDQLDGMHNRHKTIDVGGEFGVSGDWGAVTTYLVSDMLGVDNGQELRVVYSKPFRNAFDVNNLKITPSVGISWQSDNLVDYYYGVRNDEARAGRPAYDPGSAVNWLWGFDANYKLNDSWTLMTGFTYYWLGSDIRHSPIVGRDYAISIIAGAMYRF
jgi:MipA family protein